MIKFPFFTKKKKKEEQKNNTKQQKKHHKTQKKTKFIIEKRFLLSCDLNLLFTLIIKRIDGFENFLRKIFIPYNSKFPINFRSTKNSLNPIQESTNYYISVKMISKGKEICDEQKTRFQIYSEIGEWNELIQFPISIQNCPLDSIIVFSIYHIFPKRPKILLTQANIPMFDYNLKLKSGNYILPFQHQINSHKYLDTESLIETNPKNSNSLIYISNLKNQHFANSQFFSDEKPIFELNKLTKNKIKEIKSKLEDSNVFLNVEFQNFYLNNEKIEVYYSPTSDIKMKEKEQNYHFEPTTNTEKINENNNEDNNELIEDSSFFCVYDPENSKENPVELKNRKIIGILDRNFIKGSVNVTLKPNIKQSQQIAEIISASPLYILTDKDKNLLFTFRHSLIQNKKALTKFLKCVDFTDPEEEEYISKFIENWKEVDVEDCIELLTSRFKSEIVRKFSIKHLSKIKNSELLNYMLQLVSAIRHEKNPLESDLKRFLINKAINNSKIANYLYWYLNVETEDSVFGRTFKKILDQFEQEMHENRPDIYSILMKQKTFIRDLVEINNSLKSMNIKREQKIIRLKEFLSQKGKYSDLSSFEELVLPLDPSYKIIGIDNKKVKIFRSSMQPLGLELKISTEKEKEKEKEKDLIQKIYYGILFKSGDDLRQDQFVMQIINLMDKLLKKQNLDLELTPYKILAISSSVGMIEKVPNVCPLSEIIKNGKIIDWLKKNEKNLIPNSKNRIKEEVIEKYTKSCAGYCVITYILGIGDRHLDNILLTSDGHLLHIDFGFILGRDPMPFPPPFKLTSEMIEPMGGKKGEHFNNFKNYCTTAYNILRKSTNLFLNLFSMMIGANIPDLSRNDDCLLKIQERMGSNLSEQESKYFFLKLIEKSLSSFGSKLTDTKREYFSFLRD
ncbi:phosphatidylinositol 3-kinase catalytic subunit type 3 [Anaeramoeba ignava]|uniref:phosphatidylinositol 3-kinase n=1 Tax=Anaeramoeba ignava TaxID=1746090 RepID=A0A9Q0R8K6_ANAIG|nr:phosphatidylinositol 3-kinase catalytic subunit type 3 [Anaeramoeba ignava]